MARHVLQVALADEGGFVALRVQYIQKGHGATVEGDTVMADPMHRRHAPGHQGRAVGLADGAGHIEPLEAGAAGRDGIDIRRLGLRMTTETPDPVIEIINRDEQHIRLLCRKGINGREREQADA